MIKQQPKVVKGVIGFSEGRHTGVIGSFASHDFLPEGYKK